MTVVDFPFFLFPKAVFTAVILYVLHYRIVSRLWVGTIDNLVYRLSDNRDLSVDMMGRLSITKDPNI